MVREKKKRNTTVNWVGNLLSREVVDQEEEKRGKKPKQIKTNNKLFRSAPSLPW